MRLLFVAREIVGVSGGVERMIVNIMNELDRRGHHISLMTWDTQAEGRSFYALSEAVNWTKIQVGDPSRKANILTRLRRMMRIRRVAKKIKPDVIIGFQDGPSMAMLFYTAGMGIPVVAAERNAPSRFEHTQSGNRRHIVFASLYFCSKILVQLESYRAQYPRFLRSKIVAIPNPVEEAGCLSKPGERHQAGPFTLLSVGRLSYQKNFPVLLLAFALLAEDFPDWQLRIVGEGEDRTALQQIVDDNECLRGRVHFPGATKDIYPEYIQANLFCLPSRWEGFPNVLAEALSTGLPAVGFRNCAGVNDLIQDGANGLLASEPSDPAMLAAALRKLMADAKIRETMGFYAVRSVQQYSPKMIYSMWESELLEVVQR